MVFLVNKENFIVIIQIMLNELSISNFALIDEITIKFDEGLNIFTGTTGVGKSLILGALNFLLGSRATNDIVGTGKKDVSVSGLFFIKSVQIRKCIKEHIDEIDDEEDLLVIFKKYLTGQGMKVSTARDGKEALALCRERRYDIILMDYIMPGLFGLRLVRQIRELIPESRLVVITGKRIPEESAQELESHIAGLLRKPLDLKQLGETLSDIS